MTTPDDLSQNRLQSLLAAAVDGPRGDRDAGDGGTGMNRERLSEFIELIHGDSLDVLPTLAPGEFDAVVTDPPYGILGHGGKWGRKAELEWDRVPAENIADLVQCSRYAVVWGGNYFALPPSRGWLVWHKRDSVPSAADVELAWTNMDRNARLIDCTISATNPERLGHPTQKPLKVMRWSIRQLPEDARSILDPFAGSGTTGIAAAMEGRHCLLIEKDAKYCSVIRDRVRRFECQQPGSLLLPPVESDLFAEAGAP